MRHEVVVEGVAYRLRPATDDDAEFILSLRTDPELNRYIHATSGDVELQRKWMAGYYERPGDYYFIVERLKDGRAEGTIGVYSIDEQARCGEWGRWIMRSGSMAGTESAWLIYQAAFGVLGLEMVYSRTLVVNQKVIHFHESTGCLTHARLEKFLEVNGEALDAIEHRMPRSRWLEQGPLLEEKITRIGKMLNR